MGSGVFRNSGRPLVQLGGVLCLGLVLVAGISHPAYSLPLGYINTVAGNGVAGYSGDGGPATAASLHYPTGVAMDSAGNLYFVDWYNSRVRKVAAGTGIITTLINLSSVWGITVDSVGNLYVVLQEAHLVIKVAAGTGIITTVAGNIETGAGYSGDGGLATDAQLYFPAGVAVDSAGNLYIADSGNNCIRKVAAGTGVITTVAGNGTMGYSGDNGPAIAASLYSPTDVKLDSTGNLYISDRLNNRIRKVAAGTGIITTMAGNGSYASSGDNGPATAASTTPWGISIDSAGNLYIAEWEFNRIRKVAAGTGIITTVVGNGTAGFSGDNGPATAASLYHPSYVTLDTAGNLYIADTYNNRIRFVQLVQEGPTLSGIVTSAGGPVNGARIELVEYPSFFTFSGADGSFAFVVPYNTPITRKITKDGFVPAYSNLRRITSDTSHTFAFYLYSLAEYSSYGVSSGKGLINSIITDNALAPLSGVIVTVQSSLHPATPYIVSYPSPTRYRVLNTDNGDTVTVTGVKEGYSCLTQTAKTFADSVSEVPMICTKIQPVAVGYTPQWLLITIVCLTLVGGFLLRKRMGV